MNEMDAVLPLPRPPCPGNLGAGAVSAGTPSGVAGCRRPRSGSGRDEGSVIPPDSGPGRRRSSPPPPPASPAGPAQFPGSRASPPGGGAEPGPRVPSDPAAAPETLQPKPVWRGGPARERARSAGQSAGQTDPRTDGRPRTRRRAELREVPVTYTHSHTRADTQGHTHTRARTSSRQPARPLAGARSPLAGKCGASVGAFVWGAGRWRAQGPSKGGPATEISSRPPGGEAGARPRHAPMGLPTPPDWGRGPPRPGGDPALGRGEGAAATPHEARARFPGGEGSRWRSRVRASAAVAGARLPAALPLQGPKLRVEVGDRR